MFLRPFGFGECLVLCVCCLFGIYRLQAEPQPQERPPTPPPVEVAEPHRTTFSDDISSDFYQTIIKNNLFAPLGTDLHRKRVPGANLKLIGTFVSKDAARSTALIKNETTRQQHRLSLGEMIGDFQVVEIQGKQVTLDHLGKSVVLRLPPGMLLNAQRR